MDCDPNRTALREARRHQRLGGCPDICIICGEPALKTVTAKFAETHGIPRSLIEQHHIVGKQRNSQLLVPLCLTHHWKVTVGLLQENISMRQLLVVIDYLALHLVKYVVPPKIGVAVPQIASSPTYSANYGTDGIKLKR
jgi:hypothetical protein